MSQLDARFSATRLEEIKKIVAELSLEDFDKVTHITQLCLAQPYGFSKLVADNIWDECFRVYMKNSTMPKVVLTTTFILKDVFVRAVIALKEKK